MCCELKILFSPWRKRNKHRRRVFNVISQPFYRAFYAQFSSLNSIWRLVGPAPVFHLLRPGRSIATFKHFDTFKEQCFASTPARSQLPSHIRPASIIYKHWESFSFRSSEQKQILKNIFFLSLHTSPFLRCLLVSTALNSDNKHLTFNNVYTVLSFPILSFCFS